MDNSRNSLKNGDIRALKLSERGMMEFIWEALMELGNGLFNVEGQENIQFGMSYSGKSDGLLLYAQTVEDAITNADSDSLFLSRLRAITPLSDSAFDSEVPFQTFTLKDIFEIGSTREKTI